jgi:hypothetical protein
MSQGMNDTTTTEPLPTGFVIPNGSWGRSDDWTRPSGDVPLHELSDPPTAPLHWTEPAD